MPCEKSIRDRVCNQLQELYGKPYTRPFGDECRVSFYFGSGHVRIYTLEGWNITLPFADFESLVAVYLGPEG